MFNHVGDNRTYVDDELRWIALKAERTHRRKPVEGCPFMVERVAGARLTEKLSRGNSS
jgi:hypothetical protein